MNRSGSQREIDLAIIVPVYRNRETLQELTARLHDALDARRISHRVVLVDDACPEGSGRTLDRLALTDDRILALHLDANRGQHRAVLAGLAHADSKWVVVMDADLQDSPECVPQLLEAARKHEAIVFAGRRGRYESAGRLLTSYVYRLILPLIAGVPRDSGMFFAAPWRIAPILLSMDLPTPHIVVMLGFTGVQVRSIPVQRSRRLLGESSHSSISRLRSGLAAVRTGLYLRASAKSSRVTPTGPQ